VGVLPQRPIHSTALSPCVAFRVAGYAYFGASAYLRVSFKFGPPPPPKLVIGLTVQLLRCTIVLLRQIGEITTHLLLGFQAQRGTTLTWKSQAVQGPFRLLGRCFERTPAFHPFRFKGS